jgi:hypothetical protein
MTILGHVKKIGRKKMENVDVIKRGREACSVATGGCK